MNDVLHTIDGRQVPAVSGRWLDNIEPATGQVYGRLAAGDAADVDAAVQAEAAQADWAACGPEERSACLHRLADAVESELDAMARMETWTTASRSALEFDGHPRAVTNLRFFAEAALADRTEECVTGDVAVNSVVRDPIGVVGLISPWNLPLYLFTWKIAPALAAGNAVVAKPSELTPVTAARLGELSVAAGMPPGVLNIVHGTGPSVGEAMVAHPRIKAISFTGGTSTARESQRLLLPTSRSCRLNLEARIPTSSSTMRISRRHWPRVSAVRSPIRGRSACAAPAFSCTVRSRNG